MEGIKLFSDIEMLVEYAKKNIPYYMQKRFLECKCIEELPIISKTMVIDNYDLFISDTNMDKKRKVVSFVENYVSETRGITNEVGVIEDVIIEETSGTSGTPFLCAKTTRERTMIALELYKQRKKRDANFSSKTFLPFSHIGMSTYDPKAYNFDAQNIEKIYKMMEVNNIRWIHASPSCILEHVKILKEHSIKFDAKNLKFIECNGSYLSEETRKIIEKFFDVKVINHYGCIEAWPIALSCGGNNMHISEDVTYVEIVDDNGDIITESNKTGRIVITTLLNRFFPLIRYALGDYGMYVETECCCNDKGKVIQLIEGRETNIIKGHTEVVFGNIFFRRLLGKIKLKYAKLDLVYIQIIQDQLCHFTIYINHFVEVEKFVHELVSLASEDLKINYNYTIVLLTNKDILNKSNEKPNLFLCRI